MTWDVAGPHPGHSFPPAGAGSVGSRNACDAIDAGPEITMDGSAPKAIAFYFGKFLSRLFGFHPARSHMAAVPQCGVLST